ncbi:ROK family transcriptional regulator [Thermostaphylospora chromogena]|uniref:Sugar kinase of the NBD/HSP70 family, may contain an N-terminal HTH domain n=1 Tax=Thermostaphylospora chromogena TaxID=35622 RepID=A0A1H1I2G6_9ACTN|nr:ROK family transcriptional regulator [Thermostaphylospora chromogena]SDR31915.1 Sugar kinase of the NBD/HSP70 family, may contain an N-terminal HTH domain [Thermostaphylospora chromogena]
MIESTTGPRPADFTDVRATNLAVVLRFVRENAPCSRADIAASTGLNKATVSSLVADLIDRRLVRETGLTENRVGRPATMLVLDGSPYAAVGIEANVDYLTAVAVDLAGRRLLSWRRSFPGAAASANQAVAAIASLARRVANRMAKEERQVLGLAVAVPGLVDVDGRVRIAPNLGWRDVDLAKDLTKALRDPGYRVQVDNDANLGALAEHRFGPFGGTANLVYLTGEVGVGAGVIMDGRLRRGGQGYSGELGHVQIDPAGPACRCGRVGCLEAVAGVGAIIGATASDPPIAPAEVEPEIEEVVRRARAGDRETLAMLERVGTALGAGVAILANVLNPQAVILGGYYVPLAPWLLPAAEAEVRARTLAPDAGGCRLAVSTLGHDAAALGGAAGVMDSIDSGRLPQRPS